MSDIEVKRLAGARVTLNEGACNLSGHGGLAPFFCGRSRQVGPGMPSGTFNRFPKYQSEITDYLFMFNYIPFSVKISFILSKM